MLTYDQGHEELPRIRQLSRRAVLRLIGMGFGSAAMLAACGEAPTDTPAAGSATTSAARTAGSGIGGAAATTGSGIKANGKVVFASGRDSTGTVKKLVEDFNKQNNGISIEYQELDPDSTASKIKYSAGFAAKDPSIDVIASDIAWVPEFASAGWLSPLDKYVTPDLRNQFFEGTVQGATYKNQLFGLPWYMNVGLLYYRKDILEAAGVKPPATFEELVAAAAKLQKPDVGLYGFIHSGFQNEVLSATWLEVLWGFGGDFWNSQTGEVTVNSPQGEQALQWWYDNINSRKITPQQVTGWRLADIRNVFNQGNAVFMRDWADGYLTSQGADSKVVGKVGVRPMLAAAGQKPAGCLANWYIATSAFSKNPDAAWTVVQYLTGLQGSKNRALGTGLPPGIKSGYSDKELLDKYPVFSSLPDALTTARPRPVTPAYNQISASIIQVQVANVLSGKTKPKEALQAMVEQARPILVNYK